jgi:putative DNA primase/helicase
MSRVATARLRAETAEDTFALTEAGDAEHFAAHEANRLLYDWARERWYVFAEHHWRPDDTGLVTQRAIKATRRRQAAAIAVGDSDERARRVRWALGGESEGRIRHLLKLAATHRQLACSGSEWDADPMVLGVANGVIDLRTGLLRAGAPSDRVTRVAAVGYDPEARCDRWRRFVEEIATDLGLAGYLGRMFGYIVTGLTVEQIFWVLYGAGANGKTTLIETVMRYVLPEHSYAMPFPTAAWTENISEYQRAELVGRRLVVAKESEAAKRLNSEFVKSLTGTDTVNARHPYGRPFTFAPVAKIILCCNHRPIIRDESHGMWRRVRLVPFTRTFPIDATLGDKLAAEAPGILRWIIEGCLDWQQDGLGVPDPIRAATEEYQRDSDSLAAFLDDRCVLLDAAQVRAGVLFSAYAAWCGTQQIAEADRLSLRTFGEAMKRKFTSRNPGVVTYYGVGLRDQVRP